MRLIGGTYISSVKWRGSTGSWAGVQGWLASLSSVVDAGMVWRTGAPGFVGLYGAPFGVTSAAANERGCYGALQLRPHHAWMISGYVDMFSFPGCDTASAGPPSALMFVSPCSGFLSGMRQCISVIGIQKNGRMKTRYPLWKSCYRCSVDISANYAGKCHSLRLLFGKRGSMGK